MLNRDEIDPQGAVIRQTTETAVAISEELESLNPNIEIDAKEFGEHVRNGGWRLGLLVARSVELSVGGRPSSAETVDSPTVFSRKISARAFARQAGNIKTDMVLKYLKSWNMAAANGLVPPSSELSPGQEYSFDDELHTDSEWKKYFIAPSGDNEKTVEGVIIKPIEKITAIALRDWICLEQFDGTDNNLNTTYQAFSSLIRKGLEGQALVVELAKSLNVEVNTDGTEE